MNSEPQSPLGDVKEILREDALTSAALKNEPIVISSMALAKALKPIIEVRVDTPEINPYPADPPEINSGQSSPRPKSEITVTARYSDGIPAKDILVQVRACPTLDLDGHHWHDFGLIPDECFKSSRPHSVLQWASKKGNPIHITTDEEGNAIITYSPPSISYKNKTLYISARDQISASWAADPTIKDDRSTITTRVPELEPMYYSETSECPDAPGLFGGAKEEFPDGHTHQTYIFEAQISHRCIFYNTKESNEMYSVTWY